MSDAARSVALSALLTARVRPPRRTAPLHGFDAPVAGTAKSLLAEMAGLLATVLAVLHGRRNPRVMARILRERQRRE